MFFYNDCQPKIFHVRHVESGIPVPENTGEFRLFLNMMQYDAMKNMHRSHSRFLNQQVTQGSHAKKKVAYDALQ